MNASLAISINEPGHAGEARRTVAKWGQEEGWADEIAGRVALIVTELAGNLTLHTNGGTLLLRMLSKNGAKGVEVLSLDRGPGVNNFNECLRDGYSTAGTSGIGLGAVKRASQVFAVHSQPAIGTALLSQVWGKGTPPGERWISGGVNVAVPPEVVCGDSWSELLSPAGNIRVILADGLGHGEFAAEAARLAVDTFAKHSGRSLEDLFAELDGRLRATRGAAVAVAEIDLAKAVVSFAGIGNIAASIVTHERSTSLVSMNGTLGAAQNRRCRVFSYPWPAGGLLVMASDGLKTQWRLDRYTGLLDRHPSLIAGILYRDYSRGSDDATVVALRLP